MIKKVLVLLIIVFSILGCSNISKGGEDRSKEEKYARIRGINLAAEGKYEEALKNFMLAQKYDGKNVFTVRSIGIMYCKLGDFEKGKKYFNDALKIEPSDSETLYNLAIIYYNDKNYNKALEILLSAPPEKINLKIIKAKAILYYEVGDYNKSYNEFQQIIAKDETDINVFVSYVKVLKKLNKNDEIYKFTYSLFQKNKEKLNFIFLFVDYLTEIGAFDEGLSVLKEYGNNYEFSTEVILKMTEILYEQKDYDGAEKYLNVVFQKDSLDERVLSWKYKIYTALNKTEEADAVDKILKKIKKVDDNEKQEK